MVDEQLRALIEQAGRNLAALELLTRTDDQSDEQRTVTSYQARFDELQLAYRRETNELTLFALRHAIDRRNVSDRRLTPDRRRTSAR